MQQKDPDKFEIRFDDTAPEPIDPEDLENQRFDRLRRRVTVAMLLVACLLGALLAAGYYDLKRRMTAVDTTGSSEVQKISKTLESSFSSVSVQVAKLEEKFDGRLDSLQQALGETTRRIDKIEERLGRLDKEKIDRKTLSTAVQKQDAAMAAAEKKREAALAEAASARQALETKVSSVAEKADAAVGQVDNLLTQVQALEAEVEALGAIRAKMEVLDLARKSDKEELQKRIGAIAGDLEGRIEALSRRLTDLSRKLAAQRTEPLASPPPPAEKPAPPSSSSGSSPDSGKIIEQDLE